MRAAPRPRIRDPESVKAAGGASRAARGASPTYRVACSRPYFAGHFPKMSSTQMSSFNDPMILVSQNAGDSQTPLDSTVWMSFNTETGFIGQAFQCSENSVSCSADQCPTLSPTSNPSSSPTTTPSSHPSSVLFR